MGKIECGTVVRYPGEETLYIVGYLKGHDGVLIPLNLPGHCIKMAYRDKVEIVGTIEEVTYVLNP